jgi:hypothetical protein
VQAAVTNKEYRLQSCVLHTIHIEHAPAQEPSTTVHMILTEKLRSVCVWV